jgi:transcriptional regulator with XRE-family HTH domain
MDERTELIRFGEQLRHVREEQSLSIAEVAARTGMGQKRIARLEAGLSDPRYDGLFALSRGLGVAPSALIPSSRD